MIIDSLDNAVKYHSLGSRIRMALEYLGSADFSAMEPGRVELQGDECYALIQRYDTREMDNCKWESHRRYIDVQYVASGRERMGWVPAASMTVKTPYNETKDQTVLSGDGSFISVPAGYFAIFGPDDAHMPCVADGEPSPVVKVVVKVAL